MLDVDVQRSALNLRGSVMVGATDLFRVLRVVRGLQFGESWPEIFEEMNTSPNQPLEATGVSTRDWPWSFRFAPSVLAGASAGR